MSNVCTHNPRMARIQAVKVVLDIADGFPPVTVHMPEAQCFLDASQARILAAILVAYAAELETS